MTEQLVTWGHLIALSGVVMAVAAGLTAWLVRRIDKLADAITALQVHDASSEAAAERRFATHDDLDRLERRLLDDALSREGRIHAELGEIKSEIRALRSPGRAAE